VGRFHNLYDETHKPEPTRLLVAVIKALQSTDPAWVPTTTATAGARNKTLILASWLVLTGHLSSSRYRPKCAERLPIRFSPHGWIKTRNTRSLNSCRCREGSSSHTLPVLATRTSPAEGLGGHPRVSRGRRRARSRRALTVLGDRLCRPCCASPIPLALPIGSQTFEVPRRLLSLPRGKNRSHSYCRACTLIDIE